MPILKGSDAMSKSIVFIPQEPRRLDAQTGRWVPLYDLAPALQFGTLKVLMPNGPTSFDSTSVVEQLKEQMAGYTEQDYIMCIGDPVLIAATVLVAGSLNSGVVTLLKYDRSVRLYSPITYRS